MYMVEQIEKKKRLDSKKSNWEIEWNGINKIPPYLYGIFNY